MTNDARLAIKAEGLTKIYNVGTSSANYDTLRERLSSRPWRRPARPVRRHAALEDVSFEVCEGETVGIVGVNGAGKTTLLKILSRVTTPSAGRAVVYGRVGCLLEAGAGFHPELTGRENIFLSGTILGTSARALRARFDDIVEFAGVSDYLDTPVKRYSSGMFVRLGFAVAVHLDPEILVVDEVLAVGDAEFQRRCFERIQQASQSARTVLFVSHNLAAMRSICTRALLLERGSLVADGDVADVLDRYQLGIATVDRGWSPVETSNYVVEDVKISARGGSPIKTFEPAEVVVTMRTRENIGELGLYVGFLSEWNERVAGLDLRDFLSTGPIGRGETIEVAFSMPSLPLLPGRYRLDLHAKDMATFTIEQIPAAYEFEVVQTPVYGGRRLDRWFGTTGLHGAAAKTRLLTDRTSEAGS